MITHCDKCIHNSMCVIKYDPYVREAQEQIKQMLKRFSWLEVEITCDKFEAPQRKYQASEKTNLIDPSSGVLKEMI